MKMYTVRQLARISGVSVRALHYYDEIGLLKPASVGANGYRYYGRDELLRLQQILLHRELGLPLEAIAALLADDDASHIERLREHRNRLLQRTAYYRQLITTVDRTIAAMEKGAEMRSNELYEGFSATSTAEAEKWVVERFASGDEERTKLRAGIEQSRQHVEGFSLTERRARMAHLADLEARLADHCQRGTPKGDAELNDLLEQHREWVAGMWGKPCSPGAYAGLSLLYESHPDFRARYEQLAAGLADYLPAAMRAYALSA